MKLKYKMFLTYSVIAILPMILLTFFSFYQFTHIIDRRMSEISSDQQDNITREVASSYTSVKQVLMSLTFATNGKYSLLNTLRQYSDPDHKLTDYEIYDGSYTLQNISQNIFYTYDFVNAIYVFTPSKSLISYYTYTDDEIPLTYDPSQDDWYQDTLAMKGKLYISALDDYPMFKSDKKRIFFCPVTY